MLRRSRFGGSGRLLRAGRGAAHARAAGRHGRDGRRVDRRATGARRPAVVAGRPPVDRARACARAGSDSAWIRSWTCECDSARAPAPRWLCRCCGPRWPHCASMATFADANVTDRSPRIVIGSLATAFAFETIVPMPARSDRPFGRGAMTALPVVGAALGALVAAVTWAGGLGVRSGQPVGRSARGGRTAGGHPRLAHRRCGRHRRRPGLLRTARTRAAGDARRVDRTVRRGDRRLGDRSSGTGVFGAVRRRDRGCRVRRPGGGGAGLPPDGLPAAPGSRLGAAVVGTQPAPVVAAWVVVLLAASSVAGRHPWQGPVAVAGLR